jgi:hypothetical protein
MVSGRGPAALVSGRGPAALVSGRGPAALVSGRGPAPLVSLCALSVDSAVSARSLTELYRVLIRTPEG